MHSNTIQIKLRQPYRYNKRKRYRWKDIPKALLRNTINYIESFFRHSAIHGFLYLTKSGLTLIEKFFWLILLFISVFFCVQIAHKSFERYKTKNTVVSLERDYYFWRTKTTSITICPMTRLNMTIFDEFCRLHNIFGNRKIEFGDFMEKLANSTYMNFDEIPMYQSTDLILDELRIKPRDYMKLIYNLTGDATLNLEDRYHIRTEFDESIVHTRQVLTEWGLCYMTNTVLGLEFTAKYMIFGEIPQEYKGDQIYEVHEATYFDNDIMYNIKGFASGMYLFIHSVYEVMNLNRNLGYFGIPASCTIESMPTITEHKFKERTTLAQRKCRFASESNLEHYPIYTKNICLQECRLNLAYKLCKCIPHFYPNLIKNPKPVCSYKQLRNCFPHHERYLIAIFRAESKDRDHNDHDEIEEFECNCMDNCKDANIIITEAFPLYESSGLFGSLGVIVNMRKYPTIRLRREIMFTFTDLLVSIGGTAGLFLGFSVLGAIEILYFFTLRLVCYLRGYKIE